MCNAKLSDLMSDQNSSKEQPTAGPVHAPTPRDFPSKKRKIEHKDVDEDSADELYAIDSDSDADSGCMTVIDGELPEGMEEFFKPDGTVGMVMGGKPLSDDELLDQIRSSEEYKHMMGFKKARFIDHYREMRINALDAINDPDEEIVDFDAEDPDARYVMIELPKEETPSKLNPGQQDGDLDSNAGESIEGTEEGMTDGDKAEEGKVNEDKAKESRERFARNTVNKDLYHSERYGTWETIEYRVRYKKTIVRDGKTQVVWKTGLATKKYEDGGIPVRAVDSGKGKKKNKKGNKKKNVVGTLTKRNI
ncbi:hypothetical protein P153DRAFT_385440 [Dothidotthia symphoricarpi CBS 119687]|uniref:Uncharacterized protein n=1 Tax=Dothidotthia symphoricarpi CBS 119687 TaxID=1392245 RepID=A0A6A6AFP2_9PLEO|nr:uncharacterized protein P153DRAFT_385440 [Dothidotthia symphoricarpi CBS 119687]KAF2129221.1 hypothetical protein P153DRAFT_385440 [Dothidotthia symphoricarpi CBS 119687]